MLEYLANFNTDGTLSFNLIEQSIPQGYRPVTTVYLPFVQTSGANVIGHGRLRLTLHGFYLNSGTEKDSRLTALILIFLALEFMPHLHNRK